MSKEEQLTRKNVARPGHRGFEFSADGSIGFALFSLGFTCGISLAALPAYARGTER